MGGLVLCVSLVSILLMWLVTYARNVRHVLRSKVAVWPGCGLCTGDMLLFSSVQARGDMQKLFTGCCYTHVGIVFIDARGEEYVWHIVSGKSCALVPLGKALAFEGTWVLRRLRGPRGRRGVDAARMEGVMHSLRGQPYSHEFWRGVLQVWAPWVAPTIASCDVDVLRSPKFCSQLVAVTYAELGVIEFEGGDLAAAALVLPRNLCQRHEDVMMAPGYSFGEEEVIRAPLQLLSPPSAAAGGSGACDAELLVLSSAKAASLLALARRRTKTRRRAY